MDVKSVFHNGILKDEIYIKVPEGIKCKENDVCKLNKAIYRLIFDKGDISKNI